MSKLDELEVERARDMASVDKLLVAEAEQRKNMARINNAISLIWPSTLQNNDPSKAASRSRVLSHRRSSGISMLNEVMNRLSTAAGGRPQSSLASKVTSSSDGIEHEAKTLYLGSSGSKQIEAGIELLPFNTSELAVDVDATASVLHDDNDSGVTGSTSGGTWISIVNNPLSRSSAGRNNSAEVDMSHIYEENF
jgi:hypothetical protein